MPHRRFSAGLPQGATLKEMPIAYIGMGANLPSPAGPPDATLAAAAREMESFGRVQSRSSLYSTEPVGFADQPRFVNAAVSMATHLSPRSLLEHLLELERLFGRDRSAGIPNGPRTLDLDILLYGDLVLHNASLDIPHPQLTHREFVLVPLCDIAFDLVVVPFQKTVSQLLEMLRVGLPDHRNAILPLQSDLWRAGPVGHGGAGGRASSADAES